MRLFLCAMLVTAALHAQTTAHRRALLIGINDYTASGLAPHAQSAAPERDWPNLAGAVNDVAVFQEILVLRLGFDRRDIVTLTDQQATRAAILQSIERQLVTPAGKDDILFFYFAGHGSQVRNSRSDEEDRLDESIVPADSRKGARDIRDKELRSLFNRILDRGARLTIVLDHCHSGSGARGLPTGARPRGVATDPRDVADPTNGPRPENRGALVLAAAQDYELAWETRGDDRKMHGAFSWALMRAIRDAAPGEAAEETFLRAQARLRADKPYQQPVMAGNASARRSSFLSMGGAHDDRTVIAVEKVRADGTVVLQGGWAHGLSIGTELRDPQTDARLIVTSVDALGRSTARITGRTSSGALLEISGWASPPGRPMRVWIPTDTTNIATLARTLSSAAARRGIRWITDPTSTTPTHVLRRGPREWELLGPHGTIIKLGGTPGNAMRHVPAGSSLFVQLPASPAMTVAEGIERAQSAEEADYILAGRYAAGRVQYAWVRPATTRTDISGLPVRTAWVSADAAELQDAALRLRRIHGWLLLESPPDSASAYRLSLQTDGNAPVAKVLNGRQSYTLVLRKGPRRADKRFVYVFVIDSSGRSVMLFPQSGSVENRFPLAQHSGDIVLARGGSFAVGPPYGIDTFFLLTTDEPLPNPWILTWDGVRAVPEPKTALEQLLMAASSGVRAAPVVTRSAWSIERVMFESVAPRRR